MKINHVFYSSCLAAALTIGGMLHASAASYLWGNTNYPMIGTTADMPDTGLYLDINSAAVKEDTADRVDVAAIILNVVQGQVSEKKVVRFRLADNQKNYVLDSRDHWMILPDSEDNPFSQAAVLLRQKVGHSTHKQTVTYLWNNTNYPMISDTSDLQDTGVYMDINSATVKDISDDGISVAVIILNVVEGQVQEQKVVSFRLAEDGNNFVLGSSGKWQAIPHKEGQPYDLAARLLRNDIGGEEHRAKYEKEVDQILYEQQQEVQKTEDDNMVDKRVEEAEAAQKAAENKDADNQAGQPAAEKGTDSDSGDSAAEGTQQKKDDDTIKVEIESKPIVEITSSSSNQ